MADHKIRTDFNIMNLVKLKTYLQEQGISASSYLKKGVSFQINCGAASVGEYNKVI